MASDQLRQERADASAEQQYSENRDLFKAIGSVLFGNETDSLRTQEIPTPVVPVPRGADDDTEFMAAIAYKLRLPPEN